jgi:asparagine synthase (glutamine-hydrolysing)
MASILGLLSQGVDRSWEANCAWQQAVGRLRSRSGSWQTTLHENGLAVAFRGAGPCDYFADATSVVCVDGFFDPAKALPPHLQPCMEHADSAPAAAVARLIQTEGLDALHGLTGTFAITIVDRQARVVHLMQDRFGTRPMFFAQAKGGWAWASEIKCLVPLLDRLRLNQAILPQVVHYRRLVGEQALVEGVKQVLPGHIVTLQLEESPRSRPYWTCRFQPVADSCGFDEWVERVDIELTRYVQDLSVRFPRVGILLSGGVDSSLLAAKASQSGFKSCVAISARYDGWTSPELEGAVRVARHLGIEHRIVNIGPEFIRASFPQLIWRMEEVPRNFSDLVLDKLIQALAPEADVILYGEAADTVLGPAMLRRLRLFMQKQKWLSWAPLPLRRSLGRLLPRSDSGVAARLRDLLMETPETYPMMCDALRSVTPASAMVPGISPSTRADEAVCRAFLDAAGTPVERLQLYHLYTDCRHHVNAAGRLSSSWRTELATPFLSNGLIDLGQQLPDDRKAAGPWSKPILRELATRYFPREWIYVKKFGFPTPDVEWMRGPLKPWLDTLREPRVAARGIFRTEVLDRLEPETDKELLWTALCLETFIRQFIEGEAPPEISPDA